jgi:GIY-YIG catalytic domain-containing protein
MPSQMTGPVVAGLQRTPLLSISEMRGALDADRTAHGVYAWWLINSRALPAVPTAAHPVEPFGLIYVGIGPGRASSKRVLRTRFGDHGKDAGRSTLRRALASLLYQREGWRLQWTDRPLLADADNDALTAWMDANLRVQWVRVSEPWDIEAEIVRQMRPPLNRTHHREHPFYKEVGEARERFRAAALATVEPPS